MRKILENNFNDKYIGGQYIEELDLGKVVIFIFVDTKYKSISVTITRKDKCKRKNIDVTQVIHYISNFIDSNNIFLSEYDELTKKDFFNRKYVRTLKLNGLKINSNDLETIKKGFCELRLLHTRTCTFYSDCNIGILPIQFYAENSIIYSLDSLNGYNGKNMKLYNTYFKRQNRNALHLNCVVLELEKTNIDYEHLLLTTSAPNLRRLDIRDNKNIERDKDLLFISGFYNLEQININGILHDWSQISKLDKLRLVRDLYCDNPKELEKLKKLREQKVADFSENYNFNEKEYLISQNLHVFNDNLAFYNRLIVSKLERVKWGDKILTKNDDDIKKELIRISRLLPEEKNNIARDKKKNLELQSSLFENCFNLNDIVAETKEKEEQLYQLVSSNVPFSTDEGIEYWVKNTKIKILR